MSESYKKMEASGTCPRRDFNNQLLNTGGRLQSSRGCWWKRGISGVSLHVGFIKPCKWTRYDISMPRSPKYSNEHMGEQPCFDAFRLED